MPYTDEILRLTKLLADYTHARFVWYLSAPNGVSPLLDSRIPIPLVVECKIMAMETAKAYRNRGELESHLSN